MHSELEENSLGNFGERETPDTHDWGYFAHLSIYKFASQFSFGLRFLDIGCGTGYGSAYVNENAHARVSALDRDARVMMQMSPSIRASIQARTTAHWGSLP